MARDTDASYAVRPTEPVVEGLRRVVTEQADLAVAHVDDDGMPPHETVHEVRKRCKEARAVLRLFRGAFDDYSEENARYRDIGRHLSEVRDAHAFVEAWDDLVAPTVPESEADAVAAVRPALVDRRETVAAEQDIDERLADVRERLVEGRAATAGFALDDDGFDALAPGLRKSYRRGRERLAETYEPDAPEMEVLHEWRKRVKYHRYHAGLLTNTWSGPVGAWRDELKELSDVTGDAHDLAEFVELLEDEALVDGAAAATVREYATRRRRELEARARPIGERLFAESPDDLVDRFGSYWEWYAE